MEKQIANTTVKVNEDGYMTDLSQWNKDIGLEMAKENDVDMTDEHWKVVNYLQEQHRNEVALSIRKVGKSGVVSIKEFYTLFPQGPLKISTKIAGIPKPASCI